MCNDPAVPVATGSVQPYAADKTSLWVRIVNGLGAVDRRFRRLLPTGADERLDLMAAWREAGALRWLLLFQILIYWARVVVPPLAARDYDVFFHLAHGRYQDEMGKLPVDAWFSFLEPRLYVDYYWLFQRLIYELWQNFGSAGLFFLRGLVFTLMLALLAVFIYGRRGAGTGTLAGLLVFTLVASGFVENMGFLRPFIFTYLFLLGMLFIVELRPGWLPLLPGIGVLWVNLHGVAHPVMIAVVLAYLGDEFLVCCRRREVGAQSRRRFFWLSLTLPTILLSPSGFGLVTFPFHSTAMASTYVIEMMKPTAAELFTVTLGPNVERSRYVVAMMIFLLALIAAVSRWQRRSLRPAHLVLAIAGTWLALRGFRFTLEQALLSLPLLSQGIFFARQRRSLPAVVTIAAIVGLLTFDATKGWINDSRGAYPWAFNSFPHLSARFLEKVAEPGSRIYNSPEVGGFYMWELGSRHSIMMDLELTALFQDEDAYLNLLALLDANVFRNLIERYHPDYLAVNHDTASKSPFLRSLQDYVPVAFDDKVILLVDRRRQPQVAEKWQLRFLDPYQYFKNSEQPLSREAAAEARRLYELEPRGIRLPTLLAKDALSRGDAATARSYIETVLEIAPENSGAWNIAGHAAILEKDFASAAFFYEKALLRTPKEDRHWHHLWLARAYYQLGDRRKALEHFRERGEILHVIPLSDLAIQVELLEEFGPAEEAAAARYALHLRGG